MPKPVMSVAELEAFLDRDFPQIHEGGRVFAVTEVGDNTATIRLDAGDRHLRPGGTVSGPAMMTLADLVLYVAILGQIGPVGMAVTTSLNINFLRKPPPGALLGEARLIKLGKRLAVGEVAIRPESGGDMVAHVTGTYSIPPRTGA